MVMKEDGNRSPTACLDFEVERHEMVVHQIRDRGIRSLRVLEAMEAVPRHLFVPSQHVAAAYADEPLPIGEGQTISQPFMVAAMADALSLQGPERVLEIGTGSGYQAAVLSLLAREVITIESRIALAASARNRLARLGYANVRVEEGDGSLGWLSHPHYAAILVGAAAPAVPQPLLDQLAEEGRLVMPVGSADRQELIRIVKRQGRMIENSLYNCRFVPLIGCHGWFVAPPESSRG